MAIEAAATPTFYEERDRLQRETVLAFYPDASEEETSKLIAKATVSRGDPALAKALSEATNGLWKEHRAAAVTLPAEEGPRFYKLSDYAKLTYEAPVWRIKNLCETEGIGIIAAPAKHGKTALCVEMGLCIASGMPFMGNPVLEPAPVLYIEQEGNEKALQDHILTTAAARGIDVSTVPFYVRHRKPTRIDTPEGIADLRSIIEETGAKVVLIGPLAFIHRQKSEDESALMAPLMAVLNDIATDFNAFIFLIHHARKGTGFDVTRRPSGVFAFFEKVRGSSVFVGHIDVGIGLWRSNKEPAGTMYVLNRNGADYMAPYDFDTETSVFTPRVIESPEEKAENDTERDLRKMVETEELELDIPQVMALWQVSDKTARKRLNHYMTLQFVSCRPAPDEKNKLWFRVTKRGVDLITEDAWGERG